MDSNDPFSFLQLPTLDEHVDGVFGDLNFTSADKPGLYVMLKSAFRDPDFPDRDNTGATVRDGIMCGISQSWQEAREYHRGYTEKPEHISEVFYAAAALRCMTPVQHCAAMKIGGENEACAIVLKDAMPLYHQFNEIRERSTPKLVAHAYHDATRHAQFLFELHGLMLCVETLNTIQRRLLRQQPEDAMSVKEYRDQLDASCTLVNRYDPLMMSLESPMATQFLKWRTRLRTMTGSNTNSNVRSLFPA